MPSFAKCCSYSELIKKIDWQNTKGVLIDIDDTLYSYKKAHKIAIKKCYQKLPQKIKASFSQQKFISSYTNYRNNFTVKMKYSGTCRSRLFAFQDFFENEKLNSPYKFALSFEDIYWKELINSIKAYKNVDTFFKACKKHKIKICAISDMQARFQIKKLEQLRLTKEIDFLVTSEEIGIEKPDLKIYASALKKLKVKKENVIMIGDNFDKDIIGANHYGINAFLLQDIK
ncbi:HAD family hydrolase [Gammaproteobacteria bacterium]|jgi:HAD superfamily hydrolase (TIGR01549 family)|nr:HAD family hydrolase [Gammaproteobacteria bacterium]